MSINVSPSLTVSLSASVVLGVVFCLSVAVYMLLPSCHIMSGDCLMHSDWRQPKERMILSRLSV